MKASDLGLGDTFLSLNERQHQWRIDDAAAFDLCRRAASRQAPRAPSMHVVMFSDEGGKGDEWLEQS